jgi:hypothetical protein
MLTEQAQHALNLLYRRANKARDSFDLERIDRALDEVIRLNSDAPAAFQIRSAMAHAGDLLRQRRVIAPTTSLSATNSYCEPGAVDGQFAAADLMVWLQTTKALTSSQRSLLQQLSAEQDLAEMATERGVAMPRMREQISRARRRARTAYTAEVMAA